MMGGILSKGQRRKAPNNEDSIGSTAKQCSSSGVDTTETAASERGNCK
jgi:hypothetical protein